MKLPTRGSNLKDEFLQGVAHQGPPPDYCTADAMAAVLGMSRQNLYQGDLQDAIPSWKVGAVRLYRLEDVYRLKHWLLAWNGLKALGRIAGNAPIRPTVELWEAVMAGDWDAICPQCGGDAVGNEEIEGLGAWCPECGVNN